MQDSLLLERMRANQLRFYRAMTQASPGAHAIELDGLLAAVIPAAPARSVFNSVLYDSGEALAASLDSLAEAYNEAGVSAWTVWVHESDEATARVLERAGHSLDARPRAMAMELSGYERPDDPELDWTDHGEIVDVSRINDGSYPFPERPFSAVGMATLEDGGVRLYVTRIEGRPASCLGTVEEHGDCGVYMVATLPEARGQGLAGRLLAQALAGARERGCETTSLQATKSGAPIYARVGYRDLGAIGMWERRRT
jgi:ribosomal protein S18 acetylase RimI-like enzyme